MARVLFDFLGCEEVGWDYEGGEGFEEIGPGGEDRQGGQGCKMSKEARSLFRRLSRFSPGRFEKVENRMPGEGEQVERGERHGQIGLAVPEIVFKLVAVVFQDVEAFVLDLPPCAASSGVKHGDIRLLGVAAYAAPVLSTLILIAARVAPATPALAAACALIVGGAVVASRQG